MNLQDLSQFHFIRPEWLWALVVLTLLWLLIGNLRRSTHWESFIAQDKLEALRVTGGRYSNSWRWLLISGWILATLAAAGPTWKQIPVPTVRDESAMVILLDLSRSMLSQDISPDRLTRTKYKLIDILRQRGDGQTALVAYAGDPHTVSPLADDPKTIEALLPALHPDIMPVQGSNTEAAIELALQLLHDAGQTQGDILLLTDGVEPEAQRTIRDRMDGSFRLTILGIGSVEAVPIPRDDGGFYRDSRGEIILTKLNRDELQILAGLSGGRYVELQADDSDIQYLLQDEFKAAPTQNDEQTNSLLYDSWEDMGYWLVLLLLPFVATSFRKGVIYLVPIYLAPLYLAPLLLLSPQNAEALSWDDIWLNPDQQGAKLLDQDDPEQAASRFKRQDWAATANYRARDYQSAAEIFAESNDSITSTYNRGNALAFQGDLEGSLAAYNEVLEQQPEHADATHNKSVVEQLLQQQEQQEQSESDENSDESSDENSDGKSEQQEGSDSDSQSESEQEQEQEQEQQENSEQQSEQSSDQQSEQEQDEQQSESEAESESESEPESEPEPTAESEQQPEQPQDEQQAQMMAAEPTPDQLEDASEQWLRAIPDDPSGLLRRKFDYETRQNSLEQRYRLQLPTNPDDERY